MTDEGRAKISAAMACRIISSETLAKMSASHKGKTHSTSPETRAKMSIAHMGNKYNLGHHMTDEQRAKHSVLEKEVQNRPEVRAKKSAARMGYVLSPESLAKISAAMTGHLVSDEVKAKISAGNKGRVMSPETRVKMSIASKGRNWKGGRQVSRYKSHAKRRLLGFNPLNSHFLNCEGHHINPNDIIYIPKSLHQSIYHNQYTGRGMAEMNALTGQYLTEDWT